MKNRPYTFLALILLSFSMQAQTELAFCEAVKRIMASQPTFFKDMKEEPLNMKEALPKAYRSNITIQGAQRTYITEYLRNSFDVAYGPYNTVEEAEKKAAELEVQFVKCQGSYVFSKYRNQHNMISWAGYEQLKSGRRDRDVSLLVFKEDGQGKFYTQLSFKAGANDQIYHSCSGKADSASEFGRILFAILDEVRSDFSGIIGKTKDTSGYGSVASNEVNTILPGSNSCEILGILGKEYSAIYYSGNVKTEAEKTLNMYTGKILKTLGSAYEYTTTTDKEGMKNTTFYQKDYYSDVKAGGVEVKMTKYKEGTYIVYIKIHHNFMRL